MRRIHTEFGIGILLGIWYGLARDYFSERLKELGSGGVYSIVRRNFLKERVIQMNDKYLTKLGAGWMSEELEGVHVYYRFNRQDGSFLRVKRFPKEWVIWNFGPDGNPTHGNSYSSFKKLLESL